MFQETITHRRYPKSVGTIARILEAAARLFVAKSYADVTINQIAEEAGLTKGAVYHHFPSKEDVYLAMMQRDLEDKRALFERALHTDDSCRTRLGSLVATFLDLSPVKRDLMRLVRRDVNIFEEPARSDLIRAYQVALPEQVEHVIREGIERGELREADPRLLSWQFVSLVEDVLNRYADSLFEDSDSKRTYILDLFFHGAAATGERTR